MLLRHLELRPKVSHCGAQYPRNILLTSMIYHSSGLSTVIILDGDVIQNSTWETINCRRAYVYCIC